MSANVNPMPYRSESEITLLQKDKRNHPRRARRWVVWTTTFTLWAVLSFGSYYLAKHYIEEFQQQLNGIQQTNQVNANQLNKSVADLQAQLMENKQNAQTLQQQFEAVQKEMAAVNEQIALTGDTIDSTDTTKETISKRITDLSKQLENLKVVIGKLEAAARVY